VVIGRLGKADLYADLSLLIANAQENWTGRDQSERPFAILFETLGIPAPDRERLIRLDPLTWG